LDGNCPFPALKLGNSKDVVLKQSIYISSYPGGVNGQAPKQSFYISIISDKTPDAADGYEVGYKTDTFSGTSGSPVLNDFGEVIAVHGRSYLSKDSNSVINDRAYLDLAIPIELYKQNQIAKVITSVDYHNRGRAKFQLGKKEEAIADYDLAIKINPNNSLAYYNRGNAKFNLGKKEEATVDYQESARLYLQQGRKKDYQDALDRIKELKI
jgi:tetratricopeptide (TPR) repeat protein